MDIKLKSAILTGVLSAGVTTALFAAAPTISNGSGTNSIVITATTATATGNNDVVIGNGAKASADTNGTRATAIGATSQANGTSSVSIGQANIVSGEHSAAIGTDNQVNGMNSMAIGSENTIYTDGGSSLAVGDKNQIYYPVGIAMGKENSASASYSFAGGYKSKAGDPDSKYSGYMDDISHMRGDDPSFAYGYRTTASNASVAFGVDTTATGINSMAAGFLNTASGSWSTALGRENIVSGEDSTVLGYHNTVSGIVSTAIGGMNNVSGNAAIAIGYFNTASGEFSAALGFQSVASGEHSTTTGQGSKALGENSLAVSGGVVDESATNSIAIGKDAEAKLVDTVALGSGSVADRASGVTGWAANMSGSGSAWTSTANAIAVGTSSTTRQIIGVAAGSEDTDAVNVAQLKTAKTEVKGNGSIMVTQKTADDGHTIYTINGVDKGTRNTVKAGNHVTVAEDKNKDGSSTYTVSVKTEGKVEQDNTDIVTGNTVYNETHVEQDGNYVKQSNSAGDNLSILDNQVHQNASNIDAMGTQVTNLSRDVNELDSRINKVGAGAAALAALHPLDYDSNAKWEFAAGFGSYKNAQAAAIGVFYRPNYDTMFSISTTMGDDRNMFNAGVTLRLGHSSPYAKMSKAEMAGKLEDANERITQQEQKINSLEVKLAEIEAMLNK